LEKPDFLARIYDLDKASTDPRFKNGLGDIWQHRVNNPQDWPDDWVFTDTRFDLQHGDDELVLQFLAEVLHPIVRSDEEEVAQLLKSFNQALARDGYELYAAEWISGHAVYRWRRRDSLSRRQPELPACEGRFSLEDLAREVFPLTLSGGLGAIGQQAQSMYSGLPHGMSSGSPQFGSWVPIAPTMSSHIANSPQVPAFLRSAQQQMVDRSRVLSPPVSPRMSCTSPTPVRCVLASSSQTTWVTSGGDG
jgi:AbiJ N-terminal domain 3